ncbi:MAG: VWA domain-containing protein [Pseudomonadota bacterium]|nr:VWA domain-containing protein [Pseudomonadota bacterium]
MPLSPLQTAAASINADLAVQFPALMASSEVIQDHVVEQAGAWQAATRTALASAFPLQSHEQRLLHWQAADLSQDAFDKAVVDYTAFCKAIRQPATEVFWRSQAGKDDRAISTRLLREQWQKQLDLARADWELHEIAARRAALLEELVARLKMFAALDEKLSAMGIDTGFLFDLSAGNLTPQNIAQLQRWVKYLAEDKGMQALCELLGKMRQAALTDRIERVLTMAPVKTTLPDIDSREEIIGIRLGRDIEHLLPSELALLADPDTALLFDLKYVESSLMCFDMRGLQDSVTHVVIEEERSVTEADKLGPMVICIDTSGSMNGMPETIAKAVALRFAAQAREQQRRCYLINFSTSIETLDLSDKVGPAALMGFLHMSFHGGTDIAPALNHALDTMEQDTYKNADLLIISDFIMAALPDTMQARIDRRRQDGNKFHSLVVDHCYMTHPLKSLFDNEWIIDPGKGRIHELMGFERKVRHTAANPP